MNENTLALVMCGGNDDAKEPCPQIKVHHYQMFYKFIAMN